jgi:multimeric flavodoxin WrbA
MKALGLCGSARRGGNTDLVIQAVLEGAGNCGFDTEEVFLHEVAIGPCVGCGKCKDGSSEVCTQLDGWQPLMEKVKEADLIVIGSPVYMSQVTGQTKMFLDRLYSLRRKDRTMRFDGSHTRGVVVATSGNSDPVASETTRRTLGVFFRYLNSPEVVEVVAPGVSAVGDAGKDDELITRARETGFELASKFEATEGG